MSFGRNPHLAKAEAAELKAATAKDSTAYEHAWREAGRLWERAANREADPKRKAIYTEKAEQARATADGPFEGEEPVADEASEAAPDPSLN